jgi:hypothetical protein
MSTAITATKIAGPHTICPDLKVAVYKLAFPDTWTAAGVALDCSGELNYVTSYVFGCSGAVTDHGYKFDLIGTYTADGLAAASLTVVAHWSAASAAVLDDVDNSTNLSGVNDLILTVFGK